MLEKIHRELGIPPDYGIAPPRPRFREARELVDVGPNLVGRPQRLTPRAAERWISMQRAADAEGVALLLVSGYRSVEYQAALIRKKIEAGQTLEEILAVNAAPGFSQHHTGEAVDVATPGYRPLMEEFEDSPAFAWLTGRAVEFGFRMSYPPDNPEGFVYEPWHWALEAG